MAIRNEYHQNKGSKRSYAAEDNRYRGEKNARGAKSSAYQGKKHHRDYERPVREQKEQPIQAQEEAVCENMLEGRNPVKEAIRAGRTIERILVSNSAEAGSAHEIAREARKQGVLVQEVDRIRLDKLSTTGAHQGIIAYVAAKDYCEVSDILEYAQSKGEDPFIVILNGITDPQNLGSILRSAECAGVHGVIIPKRRAVGLTPTVAKASAGAIEYMRVAKVNNISQTIEQLKKCGVWVFGASMDGESYTKTNLRGPIAVVIGAEGEGLSPLVRKNCDRIISLPLNGKIESLNAAVSAAVILYEAVRQRSAGK